MHQKVPESTRDPRIIYADIIDLPHHQSRTRPHMSLYDRAAQFAAFKALSGYEDMITEEARFTDAQQALNDLELDRLGRMLTRLDEQTQNGIHPSCTFTVFIPDGQKSGGRYEKITDIVKKIDTTYRKVVLMSTTEISRLHKTIDFDRIADIRKDS